MATDASRILWPNGAHILWPDGNYIAWQLYPYSIGLSITKPDPTNPGTTITEPDWTGYSRVLIDPLSWDYNNTTGQYTNNVEIDFAAAGPPFTLLFYTIPYFVIYHNGVYNSSGSINPSVHFPGGALLSFNSGNLKVHLGQDDYFPDLTNNATATVVIPAQIFEFLPAALAVPMNYGLQMRS